MTRILAGLVTCIAVLLVCACGGSGSYSLGSSAPAPTDVVVAAGDTSATVSWTMSPGVDYWIMFAPADSITTANWTTFLGARSVIKAVSPQLIAGLINGTTYAFTVNGRVGNGPGGPGTPSQAIVPRIAGSLWTPGSPVGSGDLRGAALGTATVLVTGGTALLYTYVAVGSSGSIYSSADAKAWTARNSTVTADLNAATYGGNFVAAGANGSIVVSNDAVTWGAKKSGTTSTLNGIAGNGGGTYVAVGSGGSITTSTDSGANWVVANSGTTQNLNAVAYGTSGGLAAFVAVGANGTILASPDGLNWSSANINSATTADLKGIVYTGSLLSAGVVTAAPTWVAVGSGGTIISSSDAATWTARSSGISASLNAAGFVSRFVAVGDAGAIVTSDDGGVSWQTRASNSAARLAAMTHNGYGYLVVGAAGANLTSY